MIKRMSHVCIYVLNQDSALEFYTAKLGMEVRTDVTMGEGFEGAGGGFRWLTVGFPGEPEVEYILSDCAMGHDPDTADQMRELVAKGALGPGVFTTDDCRGTYTDLSSRGVEFLQEPVERPYGIEAILRDDSGNWFSMTEHSR